MNFNRSKYYQKGIAQRAIQDSYALKLNDAAKRIIKSNKNKVYSLFASLICPIINSLKNK